ncbi:putative ribonuclease H-like domain-containing protein [Tanacetum coccineum]
MNYVPVVEGSQTNGIVGTRDNIVTGQPEKKTKPEQEYILIPLCTTDPLISQDPKDSKEDSRMKPTKVDVSGASDKDGEDDQATRINAARTSEEHLFEQFSPFKNAFTLLNVPNVFSIDDTMFPDTSFTKFHKDHPEDQVIGSLKTPVQTRHMTKIDEEHGLISLKPIQALKDSSWVEAMQDELLQFKLLKVKTLVDLPRDKWAIGTKWVFRNKKDERGIVVKNKARLVYQGHTQEEGIDYDEIFAPVARIDVTSENFRNFE